jgi:hypothetical protein
MRTTLRIDDDLLRELKAQADREQVALTELVNRLIRRALETGRPGFGRRRRVYREQVVSMGRPRVPLDKALSIAAGLEDDEVAEELARRK